MFISVRRYREVEVSDELIAKARDGILAVLAAQPGFRGYHVVDGGDGNLVSISMFDSAEAAARSNEVAAAWVKELNSPAMPPAVDQVSGPAIISG